MNYFLKVSRWENVLNLREGSHLEEIGFNNRIYFFIKWRCHQRSPPVLFYFCFCKGGFGIFQRAKVTFKWGMWVTKPPPFFFLFIQVQKVSTSSWPHYCKSFLKASHFHLITLSNGVINRLNIIVCGIYGDSFHPNRESNNPQSIHLYNRLSDSGSVQGTLTQG